MRHLGKFCGAVLVLNGIFGGNQVLAPRTQDGLQRRHIKGFGRLDESISSFFCRLESLLLSSGAARRAGVREQKPRMAPARRESFMEITMVDFDFIWFTSADLHHRGCHHHRPCYANHGYGWQKLSSYSFGQKNC